VCKGTGFMCGVVGGAGSCVWAGYFVKAGHSVQGYRVNVWSCTVGRILCEGMA
jgi:hypothetical protein